MAAEHLGEKAVVAVVAIHLMVQAVILPALGLAVAQIIARRQQPIRGAAGAAEILQVQAGLLAERVVAAMFY
jgi:hypothetical protein